MTIYRDTTLQCIPALLGMLDRTRYSVTFGSFDRQHWAWANKDFGNTDFQRAVLPLAIAWGTPGNRYHGDPAVRSWIEAGIRRWCAMQHANGSFDQWYPFECSYGTTAFTLGPVLDAALRLGPEAADKAGDAFIRAGDFLLAAREGHGFISNHQAGAALALYRLARWSGLGKYEDKAWSIVEAIRARQSPEGWFEEYGGADPGYETLGISYLAKLWKLSGRNDLLPMLERSLDFIAYFFHPDGTVGGEYGSRNTQLFYPAGFEILAPRLERAAAVAHWMRGALDHAKTPTPASADIFNFVPLLSDYAEAWENETELPPRQPLPAQGGPFERYFPGAGLAVRKTASYYAVAGLSKGGTLRMHDAQSGRLAHLDCGLAATLPSGKAAVTMALDTGRAVTAAGSKFSVTTPLYPANEERMTPLRHLVLRLFSLTLGRWTVFGEALKRILAARLVTSNRPLPHALERTIRFNEDSVEIIDTPPPGPALAASIAVVGKSNPRFMGSAMYFSDQELDHAPLPDARCLLRGEVLRRTLRRPGSGDGHE